MLVLVASIILVLPGCVKDHRIDRTPTTFTLYVTGTTDEAEETGYFLANGDPTVSGTFIMQIHVDGDSLHCSQTLSTTKGNIVIRSDCSLVTMTGIWFITEGSGSYRNLRGEGTLIMDFPKDSPAVEALSGVTWRRR